jgi:hypothetical protein
MSFLTLLSLVLALSCLAVGMVWFFFRTRSETDLGSISRNWITEHRNDHE